MGIIRSTEIDRRACLRLVSAGALGWISTRMIACASASPEDAESITLALEAGSPDGARASDASDAGDEASSDAHAADAGDAGDAAVFVILYDTYAQALYFDGTYGPKTGIVRALDVAAGADKVYDFWHGHGGSQHRFTLTAAHFADLKLKKRVNLETSVVDGHKHQLFVDPVSPTWRVPGATPVPVPV